MAANGAWNASYGRKGSFSGRHIPLSRLTMRRGAKIRRDTTKDSVRLSACPVLNSVDDLLSPATLSELTGRPVVRVRRLPFSSVDGRSGSALATVEAEGAGGYILKRISWQDDVVMRLTDDREGRAVVIWREGLRGLAAAQTWKRSTLVFVAAPKNAAGRKWLDRVDTS